MENFILIYNIFVKNIYNYSVYVKTILILKFYGTFFKSVTVSGNYHADNAENDYADTVSA